MKTLIEYQEEHAALIKQLEDFKRNLPSEFAIIGGKVEENTPVLFATLGSYSDEGVDMKHIVFEPKNVNAFRKDLKTLIQALHVEHYKSTLSYLPIEKHHTKEVTYLSEEEPDWKDEELAVVKPELFESEEFIALTKEVPENQPYHSLLLERLIREHVTVFEKEVVDTIIFDGIESSKISGHELERVALVRTVLDRNDDKITYLLAIGEISRHDYQDYTSHIRQDRLSYYSFF